MTETVEMLFPNPTSLKGSEFDRESAILFLEILNENPHQPLLFTSNAELFEKLCEVVENTDPEEVELAATAIADPEERAWLKSYLIDYHFGNDMSFY